MPPVGVTRSRRFRPVTLALLLLAGCGSEPPPGPPPPKVTIVEPVAGLYFETRFRAGYLLAARERGKWRPALRYDRFRARDVPSTGGPFEEDGHAWTLALNWRPFDWLRVTGEYLRIDSERGQYQFEGKAPRQREDLFQLNLRYQF